MFKFLAWVLGLIASHLYVDGATDPLRDAKLCYCNVVTVKVTIDGRVVFSTYCKSRVSDVVQPNLWPLASSYAARVHCQGLRSETYFCLFIPAQSPPSQHCTE